MPNRKLALSFMKPQAAHAQDERSRLSLQNMTFAIRCVVLQGSRFTSLLRSRSQGRHAKLLPTTLNGCVGHYQLKKVWEIHFDYQNAKIKLLMWK